MTTVTENSRRVSRRDHAGLVPQLVSVAGLVLSVSCSPPGHSITYIATRPVVSTFSGVPGQQAGSLTGVVTGPGASALFYAPAQVAVDSAGNLLVGDAGSQIYQVANNGDVSVYAGTTAVSAVSGSPKNGPRLTADFYSPQGVAVDKAGNVYVADNSNFVVRKITTDGVVHTLAGSGVNGFSDGPPSTAQFNYLTSLAVDSLGNVYVADLSNHAVRKVTPDGHVSTLAGSGGGGTLVTPNPGYANGPGNTALFDYPQQVAVDSQGNVYVTDENNVVRFITPAGVVSTLAGQSPSVTGGAPATSGHQDGQANQAQFSAPQGITVDAKGNVYVVDTGTQVIREISGGVVTTVAGNPGVTGFVNGPGTFSTFTEAVGIAVDSAGNLFVTESSSPPTGTAGNAIRKISFVPVF